MHRLSVVAVVRHVAEGGGFGGTPLPQAPFLSAALATLHFHHAWLQTLPQVPPENAVPLASDTGEQVQLPFIVADDASLDTPDEGMAVPAT
jgi:hypothetical protein